MYFDATIPFSLLNRSINKEEMDSIDGLKSTKIEPKKEFQSSSLIRSLFTRRY